MFFCSSLFFISTFACISPTRSLVLSKFLFKRSLSSLEQLCFSFQRSTKRCYSSRNLSYNPVKSRPRDSDLPSAEIDFLSPAAAPVAAEIYFHFSYVFHFVPSPPASRVRIRRRHGDCQRCSTASISSISRQSIIVALHFKSVFLSFLKL